MNFNDSRPDKKRPDSSGPQERAKNNAAPPAAESIDAGKELDSGANRPIDESGAPVVSPGDVPAAPDSSGDMSAEVFDVGDDSFADIAPDTAPVSEGAPMPEDFPAEPSAVDAPAAFDPAGDIAEPANGDPPAAFDISGFDAAGLDDAGGHVVGSRSRVPSDLMGTAVPFPNIDGNGSEGWASLGIDDLVMRPGERPHPEFPLYRRSEFPGSAGGDSGGGPPMSRPIVTVTLAEGSLRQRISDLLADAGKRDAAKLLEIAEERVNYAFWVRDCQYRAVRRR